MKPLTVFIGCFLIVISFHMQFGSAAPTPMEDEESLDEEESTYHNISTRNTDIAQQGRDYQFFLYRCRLRNIVLRSAELRFSMGVSLSSLGNTDSFIVSIFCLL